jgi:hypothetical protein
LRGLARDGEGELIGWDLVDNDNRPFRRSEGASAASASGGDGTALARAVGAPGRRIVPVRIDAADPGSIARAVAFVARTPARIVVVPMWSARQGDWEPFRQAALHFKDLVHQVAAGDNGCDIDRDPVWPAILPTRSSTAPASAATRTVRPMLSAREERGGRAGEGASAHGLAAVLARCACRLLVATRRRSQGEALSALPAEAVTCNERPKPLIDAVR